MSNYLIILPNTLHYLWNKLPKTCPKIDKVLYIEEPLYFKDKERGIEMWKQKCLYHIATRIAGIQKGIHKNVELVQFNEGTFIESIKKYVKSGDCIIYEDPVDHLLRERINKSCKKYNVNQLKLPSKVFYLTTEEYKEWTAKDRKEYRMGRFYEWVRNKKNIMMENGKPLGGKYSYDEENRNKLPKNVKIPKLPNFRTHGRKDILQQAYEYVQANFNTHQGCLLKDEEYTGHFILTPQEAKMALNNFIKNRLDGFGPYQDAMREKTPFVFHSVLSCAMNNGLIEIDEIVKSVMKQLNKNNIASVEGFIRQVIGWREFTRILYEYEYKTLVNGNRFKLDRQPNKYWYGQEQMNWAPLDDCIEQAAKYAYLHHIQRLMIMGNNMMLFRIHPHAAYRWFLEFSVDSYDWVMINNVYGMVAHSMGTLSTTKPYISSDNYVKNMSDWNGNVEKEGDWALGMKSGYYCFLNDYQSMLRKSGRAARMVYHLDRLDKDKLKTYLGRCKKDREQLTSKYNQKNPKLLPIENGNNL